MLMIVYGAVICLVRTLRAFKDEVRIPTPRATTLGFIKTRTPSLRVTSLPRGSILYTTIMESGPQNRHRDGLLGPNYIMVVCMDPLGYAHCITRVRPP